MTRYAPVLGLVPGSAVAGYLIGDALDHAFATTFLRFVCLVLGVVAGIVQLLRLLSRDMK